MAAKTPAFLKSSEFTLTGATGRITAAFTQDLIDTYAILTQNALAPEMYGAVGDGVANDTTALNNCAVAACAAGVPIILTGVYSTTQWVITTNTAGTQRPAPPIILGLTTSKILARAGATSPLVRMQNVGQTQLVNLVIDCNSIVATGLDTSWNASVGPSLNNVYRYVNISNATSKGWIADLNNDCTFDHILLENMSSVVALQINGQSGNVVMNDSNISGTLDYCAQNMTISNCVMGGIRCNLAGDYNSLSMFGGYIYANVNTNINIEVATGFQSNNMAFFGTRMENPSSAGSFFGGGGTLLQGAEMVGCTLVNTAGSGGAAVVSAALTAGGSNGATTIDFQGGLIDNLIGVAGTSTISVNLKNTWNPGTTNLYPSRWRVFDDNLHSTDLTASGLRSIDAVRGNAGVMYSKSVTASSGTPGVLSGIPRAGYCVIMLANATGAAPVNTQFRYYGTTKDTAFGTGITTAAITGTTTLTLTITPVSGTALGYVVTIFGQQ
jgi:hypothetical protein